MLHSRPSPMHRCRCNVSLIAKLTFLLPDDYINATHILKAAAYDKPARTRILEREVQKGLHEKVQGGYGKYQGAY
jgi:transcription factor MBP1